MGIDREGFNCLIFGTHATISNALRLWFIGLNASGPGGV